MQAGREERHWEDEAPWERLREKAEKVAQGLRGKEIQEWSPHNIETMIHELLLYQIELQMQNLELRQAQQALEASRERYFELFDSAPVGYLTTDVHGIIQEANGTVTELLALPSGDLLRRGLGKFVLPEDQEIYYLHLRTLGSTLEAQAFEVRMLRGGREPFWARVEQRSIPTRPGGRPGIRNALMDVSEPRRLEAEKAALAAQLAEALKMESLGHLARGVAREMNRVVTTIQSLVDARISGAAGSAPLQADLESIQKACAKGRELSLELLGFAKDKVGDPHFFSLNALVRDQIALLERNARTGADVRVEADLEPTLRSVRGDSAALAHALLSLCANSLEAMPEGGRLALCTRNADSDQVLLEVSDTGEGMLPEVRARATEPFFTTRQERRASGLGLAVAFGAVRAHHGRLEIDSDPGSGTRVRIRLPSSREEPPPPSGSCIGSSRMEGPGA